jgi:hypothetical protein
VAGDDAPALNRAQRGAPEAIALIGGPRVGWIEFYDDGTALATVPGSGQRRGYRFEVARDREIANVVPRLRNRDGSPVRRPTPIPPIDLRWRSATRGERGRREREAVAHLAAAHGFIVVEEDRRGGSTAVPEEDRLAILSRMRATIDGGATVTRAAEVAGDAVGWSARKAQEIWQEARRPVRRLKGGGRMSMRLGDIPQWLRQARQQVVGEWRAAGAIRDQRRDQCRARTGLQPPARDEVRGHVR